MSRMDYDKQYMGLSKHWYVGIVSFAVMVNQFVFVIAYLSGVQGYENTDELIHG